jgi:hypothetical protein
VCPTTLRTSLSLSLPTVRHGDPPPFRKPAAQGTALAIRTRTSRTSRPFSPPTLRPWTADILVGSGSGPCRVRPRGRARVATVPRRSVTGAARRTAQTRGRRHPGDGRGAELYSAVLWAESRARSSSAPAPGRPDVLDREPHCKERRHADHATGGVPRTGINTNASCRPTERARAGSMGTTMIGHSHRSRRRRILRFRRSTRPSSAPPVCRRRSLTPSSGRL